VKTQKAFQQLSTTNLSANHNAAATYSEGSTCAAYGYCEQSPDTAHKDNTISFSADRYSVWTRQKTTLFSGHYLCNRSTLDIGVLGYIGIFYHKEHPPEVCQIPPGTFCISNINLSKFKLLLLYKLGQHPLLGFFYSFHVYCTNKLLWLPYDSRNLFLHRLQTTVLYPLSPNSL
jgi:hypothetical protein